MGHKLGVIYIDLSKTFDSLNHELLLTKLKCYNLDQHFVQLCRSKLTNRYLCCKINNVFGDWRKITSSVLQKSMLALLLFNILLNDFFFSKIDSLGTYADDSTLSKM